MKNCIVMEFLLLFIAGYDQLHKSTNSTNANDVLTDEQLLGTVQYHYFR